MDWKKEYNTMKLINSEGNNKDLYNSLSLAELLIKSCDYEDREKKLKSIINKLDNDRVFYCKLLRLYIIEIDLVKKKIEILRKKK